MISLDEDALICDLAETYQIYDYKQLPLKTVAVFASGLKMDSRIKMKMSGLEISVDTFLLAGIFDKLSTLVWFNTEDGQKGQNRPTLITNVLLGKTTEDKSDDILTFETGEEFERLRKTLLKGGE